MGRLAPTRRTLSIADRALLRSFGLGEDTPVPREGAFVAAIEAWFRDLTGEDAAPDLLARARVAWLAIDGPDRWREHFLSETSPQSLAEALRGACPPMTPRETPLAMPEQPLHAARPAAAGRSTAWRRLLARSGMQPTR